MSIPLFCHLIQADYPILAHPFIPRARMYFFMRELTGALLLGSRMPEAQPVKLLLKILAAIVVLLVLVAVLLPLLISTDDITDEISKQVTATTGRNLVIEGDKSLSILPSLSLQLNQVRLTNMESGSQPNMMSMERLDIHIPWAALLSGSLSIERFVIEEPAILLETDAEGNANWDMLAAAEPAPEVDTAPTEATTLPSGFDISLGEVAIRGGSLTYIDGQAGTEERLDQLGLAIELPSLYEALQLKGTVLYMGETLNLDIGVTTPARAINGETFEVSMLLDTRLLEMAYSGEITNQGTEIRGSLKLAGNSVKDLAAWQDVELDAGDDAFNAFEVTGDMLFSDQTLRIQQLAARLDALEIKGNSTLVLADVPDISANVDLGMLDLNPYLPPAAEGEAEAPTADEAAVSDAPSEPIVWDDTPIDLSALTSVNANITVRSDGLRARDIKLGENAFSLMLTGGKMRMSLDKFEAYSGTGKGLVAVDASSAPYAIQTDFDLSGIEAEPLLTDSVGFDKLRGAGNLEWNLKTSGRSQKDFVNRLNGTVGFSFQDGAVKGANVAAIARSAQAIASGQLAQVSLDKNFDNAAETDFSEMGGTLSFSKGVGTNTDLKLASPLIRVKGEGSIDLPATNIDYTAQARLVDTIEGQAATSDTKGISIPIVIEGPFHDVKVKPDLTSAAKEGVLDSLKKNLLKRFNR